MEIANFISKLAFVQLYQPGHGPEGKTETFCVANIFSPEEEAALPEWVRFEVKDGIWRNAGATLRHVSASTMFRPPVFGLPESWHEAVKQHNFSPDRLLVGARAEVGVSRSVKVDKFTGIKRSYLNLIAVRVLEAPPIPSFESILETERSR